MNTETDVTARIIGAALRVSSTLGTGFLEKVYENALVHELRKVEFVLETQRAFSVTYDGVVVGEYRADLVVAERVIVEIKAARAIDPTHIAPLVNYLRATRLRVGLILNFGTPRLGIKRVVI